MKQILTISLLITLTISGFAQNERKFIRNGNDLFMEAVKDTTQVDTVKFSNAETEYRKALNKRPTDAKWNFNLADALYKQQRFDEAAGKFEELEQKLETPEEKARALHNLGNSQLMQQKLDESIESYKKALRKNPSDLDTKYNLAYAQNLKKQQEQQQQNQDKNKDQDKDQDKDKDKEQDKNQDKNKDQNKDQQDQQNQDQQQNKDQQKQQQQPQNKISKENAEQLLQALQNDERDIQDKVKKAKAAKARKTNVEKEW